MKQPVSEGAEASFNEGGYPQTYDGIGKKGLEGFYIMASWELSFQRLEG